MRMRPVASRLHLLHLSCEGIRYYRCVITKLQAPSFGHTSSFISTSPGRLTFLGHGLLSQAFVWPLHSQTTPSRPNIVTRTHKFLIATIVFVKLDSEVENQKMPVSVFFPSLLVFGYLCFNRTSETSFAEQ